MPGEKPGKRGSSGLPQGARKAELVAVSLADVKEALPPRCIRRRRFRIEPGLQCTPVHRIHVVYVEHDAAPSGSSQIACGVELQVEVAAADPEARELSGSSSVEQTKAERLVERHRFGH